MGILISFFKLKLIRMLIYFCYFQTEDIEYDDYLDGKPGDTLTIYDGPNEQSTQIAKLSGNQGSFSISSTGYSLFVKFQSDSYFNYGGFLATIHYGNSYFNMK